MTDFNKGALNIYAKKEIKQQEKKKAKRHYNVIPKEYKIVGIRFTKEEYEQVYKHAKKYSSMSDYIKSVIFNDINK